METAATARRDLISELLDLLDSDRTFTDIHIEQDAPLRIKTPREWTTLGSEPIHLEDLEELLNSIDANWKAELDAGAIDQPIVLTKSRLRCNVYRTGGGRRISIAIRRLPLLPLTLEQTGLPMYIKSMAEARKGLVLVTGPTGAGKTTSVAALLDYLNGLRSSHIITIEQPIEYVLPPKRSIVSQKEIGTDVADFSVGLREALRQRPDVIMVGEVRDVETADTVMHAAESGHLVFATLHTASAPGAINKLLSFFPPDKRGQCAAALADSLVGVVCQSLVATEDGRAFVLASELLFNNNQQVSQFIADPDKFPMLADFMRRRADNMSRCLNDDLVSLAGKGVISQKDAMLAAYNRIELHDMLSRHR